MKLSDLTSAVRESAGSELTANPEVAEACDGFPEQVLPLAPLTGVAVVLLDEGRTTSRVVFSWQSGESGAETRQTATEAGNGGEPPKIDSSCLTLTGSAGVLGAVLMRIAEGSEPLNVAIFHDATQRLASRLEESVLRQRLDRSDREAVALSRISSQVANGSAIEEAYQSVVDEIKGLVDFHRFTFFLIDRKSSVLECAFEADGGGQSSSVDGLRPLAGTGCESLMLKPQSRTVDDLQALPGDDWPELSRESGFRSAVIAPMVHKGDVVGAAVARNSYPKAFGMADESLICLAVDLLIPAIIGPATGQPAASDTEAGNVEISNIITVGHKIEDMLDLFADAARKLIKFDFVTVTWLDPNGLDIHTSRSNLRQAVDQASSADHDEATRIPIGQTSQKDLLISIQARL